MSTMRSMTVPEAGGSLQMIEQDLPAPGPREVVLRVLACGVCHSDSVTVEGLMPGITYPRVPGHEVIGTLEAVGPDVRGWQVGTRVGVGWFGGACGYCARCRRGEAFACETVTAVTGVTRDGGYAMHMLADASALALVPDALDAIESAPLLCAGITTFNALRNCGAGPGDLVVIHGVGGSAILVSSSPRARASTPSRSTAGATRSSSRVNSARTTTSIARTAIPPPRCGRWAVPRPSSQP